MGAFVIPSIFTAVDKVSATVRKMSNNVQNFAQRAETGIARADRAFRQLTPSIGKIGKQFLQFASAAAISAAIIGGITFSFNTIKEFETGLVGVGKTTGIADQELKKLGASIVVTSDQLKTISAGKLLELAESAGQLGVTGTDNIIRFSTTLAKLEKASDIKGEEGAKSIARLLTITKEGVGIVDRFASTLVALGNASAASESEILSVASEVSRATAAYKLNSTEILGIAASLKSLDVAPEAAGSAIGKVFRGIELATIKGGDKLDAFAKIIGLTPKAVKESFGEDPRKTFSLFIRGLGRISDEGGSVAKALIDAGLSGERVSKGIVPLATNFELLEEKIALASKASIENTALNEEFDASQKTVQSGINSIIVSWSNLVITQATAGSSLETVQNALFFVSDNLATMVKLLGITIGVFLGWKAILVIGRGALNLYNIALGISTIIQNRSIFALRGNAIALGAYSFAAKAATVVQWLLNAAISANPISIIILVIAGLITGIEFLVRNWDEWRETVIQSAGPLTTVILLIETLKRNWDDLITAFNRGGFSAAIDVLALNVVDVADQIPVFSGLNEQQLGDVRRELELKIAAQEAGEISPVNVAANTAEAERIDRIESSETSNLNIRIQDETGRAEIDQDSVLQRVRVESTFGFSGGPKF